MGRKAKAVYVKDRPGSDFQASREVEGLARSMGYAIGSMEHSNPVALYRGASRVGKWNSLDSECVKRLDGIIVSDDFRSGPVVMVKFQGEE